MLVACTPLDDSSVSCARTSAGVVWSLVLAALAMVCTVAIPWLTGRAVDQISARRPRRRCARSRSRSSSSRVARLGLSVAAPARRRAGCRSRSSTTCATCSTRTCRSSSSGFFAGQQTGQLMSRATVDLSSVRFFLGYGLVFILQSGADDPARRGRDVLALARAGGAGADPGAVRGGRRRRATGAARGRRCRRSSSGSPRSPPTSRRTSPACAW